MTDKRKVKNNYLLKKYGISLIEYEKKLEKQNGLCAICRKPPTTKSLAVDHRHVKGYKKMELVDKSKEVRGLLCFTCNVLLGKLEKRNNSREVLLGIIKYASYYKLKGDI